MAVVALVAAMVFQFVVPEPVDLPQVSDLAPRRAREVALAPTANYNDILAKPIFAPDRKPDASAVPVAGGMDGYSVLGVAIASDAATAVVKGPGSGFQRVKTGDVLDGWKLVEIEFTQLTFERGGERRVLMLTKKPPPPTPAQPSQANGDDNSNNNSSDDDSN